MLIFKLFQQIQGHETDLKFEQGITCGSIKDGYYQPSHPGFIDIFLVKESGGKKWESLFREEPDPGFISEVVAIGNYTAEEPIELTIRKGDTISVISKDETGWWKGKFEGKIGFFPSNYVKEYSLVNTVRYHSSTFNLVYSLIAMFQRGLN